MGHLREFVQCLSVFPSVMAGGAGRGSASGFFMRFGSLHLKKCESVGKGPSKGSVRG